ncbi:undecaprenyldiphospho-muramoylpentapeptide beta-N-acetylglucosaminyltransferase [Marilutibacter alkalisoli]|uniref:UDP-N-acetylglucosamine--N-acetylmuramyl-(pentapeptide) pyrophosphoryl-undecaprenol N-acetylglucosamine transferase n=1 Tax=Marilutibacter alkalisoli TaxID=2591633 RepID=A0A514BU69_9GAMM|nr:undecaprenyldiphospho-muramoylpentapeptide beta-N-acetylglucosaminyltransferase [Lysobacter alkalisoli]
MTASAASMNAPAPVMILAGGTGGHIFPGLAVARALRARGVPVRWMGAEGAMETRLVPQHDIAIDTIPVRAIRGKGLTTKFAAPWRLLKTVRAARALLLRTRPRAVISFGGFAAGPGGLAARLLGIPLIVHEQNRAPGLTNRVLVRLADRVMTGFPDTFPGRNEQVVGNPVREEIAAMPPPGVRYEDRTGPLRLLVLGGSQGARALNEAVPRALAMLRHDVSFEVRHQCGEKLRTEAEQAYADAQVPASVEPFIADMAAAYAWADVVVCRAGALTLAELCAAGVACILVPFPQAVDDHQTRNAEYLQARGAAQVLPQGETLHQRIAATLEILDQRADLLRMAVCARDLARPAAAADVADTVLDLTTQKEQAA